MHKPMINANMTAYSTDVVPDSPAMNAFAFDVNFDMAVNLIVRLSLR